MHIRRTSHPVDDMNILLFSIGISSTALPSLIIMYLFTNLSALLPLLILPSLATSPNNNEDSVHIKRIFSGPKPTKFSSLPPPDKSLVLNAVVTYPNSVDRFLRDAHPPFINSVNPPEPDEIVLSEEDNNDLPFAPSDEILDGMTRNLRNRWDQDPVEAILIVKKIIKEAESDDSDDSDERYETLFDYAAADTDDANDDSTEPTTTPELSPGVKSMISIIIYGPETKTRTRTRTRVPTRTRNRSLATDVAERIISQMSSAMAATATTSSTTTDTITYTYQRIYTTCGPALGVTAFATWYYRRVPVVESTRTSSSSSSLSTPTSTSNPGSVVTTGPEVLPGSSTTSSTASCTRGTATIGAIPTCGAAGKVSGANVAAAGAVLVGLFAAPVFF